MTWAKGSPDPPRPYPRDRQFMVRMPVAEPPEPAPDPNLKTRKTPGKRDCAKCRAAGGYCSEHVGWYESYDPLASVAGTGQPGRTSRLDGTFRPVTP